MIGRLGFGTRLRAHRERRGITLRSISESTKIKHSLLESLERGDVSQWPRGLFRRAYLRDYACAVGLPPEPLVAEFVQLFPEDGAGEPGDSAPAPLRILLDAPPHAPLRRVGSRVLLALVELGAISLLGTVAAFTTGSPVLTACGVAALAYYPIAMVLADRRASRRHLQTLLKGLTGSRAAEATELEPARLYLVGRQQVSGQGFVPGVADDDLAHTRTASR